jgi:hypothetical protein
VPTAICPSKAGACWDGTPPGTVRAIELAKKTVNSQAGVPSEAERWTSNQSFLTATTWPDTQVKIGRLMGMGLQQDTDLERNFSVRIGELVG